MPFHLLDDRELSLAVSRLAKWPAISVKCLSAKECSTLVRMADQLVYRRATPVTGYKAAVYQDFELDYAIPPRHCFWNLARSLREIIQPVLRQQACEVGLVTRYTINDLIVQRYPPGCHGISAHRDHIAYEAVVAILLLSGDGDFRIHSDREELEARTVPFNPGELLLMGAPGIAPGFKRPFHSVGNITRMRRTIGLRYDSRVSVPR